MTREKMHKAGEKSGMAVQKFQRIELQMVFL